jgi:hypothetical protein
MTFLWFGLSELIGAVSSRIILGAIYIFLVLPVGLARRLAGCDELRLRDFKKGSGSVFKTRERFIEAEDIRDPY